ncbi:ankyrin [Stipitochalara longipes BDJ]|nr:ankyrin [Stipitochalara longipes BDJ]
MLDTPASAPKEAAKTAQAIHREGLTVLSNPTDADLDIVFLHGLNGHPHDSFASHKTGFYWPSEFAKNVPSVRAMAFGYIADFSSGSHNSMGIRQHAESLLVNLRNNRQKELSDRSRSSATASEDSSLNSATKDAYKEILSSTQLICFMGTPHRGSHVLEKLKVSILEKIAKAAFHEIPYNLKSALKPRANELFEINDAFAGVKGSIVIVNFYEQKHMKGLDELIVDKDSAVLYFENEESIPIFRDHRELIRFDNSEDDAYRLVFQTLQAKLSILLHRDGSKTYQDVTNQMRRECLQSLKFAGAEKRVNDISEPSENTLGWLYEEELGFKKWLEQETGIYWVGGKPGSGKSTLMKEMASHHHDKYSSKGSITATHFFDDRGTFLERSFEGFLRSILEQILRREPLLFDFLIERFRNHFYHRCRCCPEDGEIRWNIRSLKAAFRDIVLLGPPNIRLCLFIDALDECDMPIKELIDFFKQLEQDAKLRIKICFSSRNLSEDILKTLPMGQGFMLQEQNSKDIINFVNEKLASTALVEENGNDLVYQDLMVLKEEIIHKADGVFLWVSIVLSEFERGMEDGNTVAELRENLKAIPGELSGLFDILLEKIDPAYISETNIMFSIVLNAARPLTLSEFRYAMAFSSEKDFASQADMKASKDVVQTDLAMMKRMRSRCGGLLEAKVIQDSDDTRNTSPVKVVQFIHQSVKDYFLSGRNSFDSQIWNSKDLTAKGHANLSQACIKYLCTSEVLEIPPLLKHLHHDPQNYKINSFMEEFPLLGYSVANWTSHCKEAEKLGLPQLGCLDAFNGPNNKQFEILCELLDLLHPSDSFEIYSTPLHIAVQYNILSFVKSQVQNGVDINLNLSGEFASYLQMAAFFGNEEMVNLLLDHGADVEARGGRYESVLTAACISGNAKIVKAILEGGADTSSYGMTNSPLWAAAVSGKAEVVQILFNHDQKTFENGWSRHLALFYVGIDNREKILEPDDSKMVIDMTNSSNVSELLLTQGVDFFTYGPFAPWIQYIVMKNSHAVIKKLLIDDADMCNRRDPTGLTLLHLACMGSDEKAVKLLLENGADSAAETETGMTILHAAIINPSDSVLRYLLRLGIDPKVLDYYGRTAFHCAAKVGTDSQLSLLIAAAAKGDIASPDLHGFLPLHYAMRNRNLTNQEKNLDALISPDLGINAQAQDSSTPLHIAARYGNVSHIHWLIRKGANLLATDLEGRTALHCAAANNNDTAVEILNLLISHGLSVFSKDDAGLTPLHNTLYWHSGPFFPFYANGNVLRVQKFRAKIRLLLKKKADLNARDCCGNTVLHLACSQNNQFVVRLLLDEGADPDLKDFNGCKPIDLARRDDIRALLDQ